MVLAGHDNTPNFPSFLRFYLLSLLHSLQISFRYPPGGTPLLKTLPT
jgi:hypothetical protein